METYILWQLALQLFLIVSNALFACAEIAVISMNDHKLEQLAQNGDKRASQLVSLTSQPAKFLATIQVAITFSGFLASAFAADNFSDAFVAFFIDMGIKADPRLLDAVAVVLITLLLSYVTLVFGELVPKRMAMKNPQKIALALAGLISFVAKSTSPLVWLLTKSTNGVLRLLGINPHAEDSNVSEEEIIMMVDVGLEKGVIDKEEKDIIHNLFRFDDFDVSKITTHRTQVDVLWLDESMEAWEETICKSRHAKYPVCNKVIDNVVGVLRSRDYFCSKHRSKEYILENVIFKPYYVLKNFHADIVFKNMRQQKQTFAFVIDEYASVFGILTITDLAQGLIGHFDDDMDTETDLITVLDNETWLVKGNLSLEKLSQELNLTLPIGEYHTVGGYILGLYGSIPPDNSCFKLETDDLIIIAESIKDRTLQSAYIKTKEKL